METTPLRVYGGVAGGDRQAERRAQFVEAGLDLLGSGEELTVRGVCRRAGLASRYFYESFTDRDALAEAVFDQVVGDIVTRTLAAVAAAPADATAKSRAGLATLVRIIADDPRTGRLLFSPAVNMPVLLRRRASSARMFARVLGSQARAFYGEDGHAELELDTEFLVGGLAQTLTSWLDDTLAWPEEAVVERCVTLFVAVGDLP